MNENINEENIPQISRLSCHVKDCSNDWKSKQKKINGNTNECIENCDNINQYEYNGKCISSCSYAYLRLYNNNAFHKCKCELDQCLACSNVALENNLCT